MMSQQIYSSRFIIYFLHPRSKYDKILSLVAENNSVAAVIQDGDVEIIKLKAT